MAHARCTAYLKWSQERDGASRLSQIFGRLIFQVKEIVLLFYGAGGKHKTCGPSPALHLVLPGPAPCFYPAAAPSSHLTVKEQLHLYSPKTTFGPLKATRRLMQPPVKMS